MNERAAQAEAQRRWPNSAGWAGTNGSRKRTIYRVGDHVYVRGMTMAVVRGASRSGYAGAFADAAKRNNTPMPSTPNGE